MSVLQHSSVLTNVELLEILLGEICRIGGSVDEPNKVKVVICTVCVFWERVSRQDFSIISHTLYLVYIQFIWYSIYRDQHTFVLAHSELTVFQWNI